VAPGDPGEAVPLDDEVGEAQDDRLRGLRPCSRRRCQRGRCSGVGGRDRKGSRQREPNEQRDDDVATTGQRISDDLLARHALEPGAVVVFVSVSEELGPGPTNFVKLQTI